MKNPKIAICQMKVIPGNPRANADYMIQEITKAAQRRIDIIIFPELAVPGYLLGDKWEDVSFVRDVQTHNERIIKATEAGIVAIFGSLTIDESARNEDGRTRKMNSAIIAANGKLVDIRVKTLQPDYRIFDDTRHFFSARQIANETNEKLSHEKSRILTGAVFQTSRRYQRLINLSLPKGRHIKLGVILCEDMWHEDYPENPTEVLLARGAELIINLSASPWSWQKNRKRHQVVKDLMAGKKAYFVYVNNTGIQNNGKNIVVFDGASTVYGSGGTPVYMVEPYHAGTFDFELTDSMKPLEPREQDDTKELWQALRTVGEEVLLTFVPEMRRVVIGASGGIDSSVSAAIYAHILGPEKVRLAAMPSKYSSQTSIELAKQLAANLGIGLEIIPIQESVDVQARILKVESDILAYENIQARVRTGFLATMAQVWGGLYTANFNKVEAAFGYGTLHGDIAGFLAILGDLLKREVYQVGNYLNGVVFGRDVIPAAIFEREPTAELKNNQKDPFHYGNLRHRGYHDEMVQAFVNFRLDPEWFLERMLAGELESALRLETGTINMLFPRAEDMVADLELNWRRFHGSVFKRTEAPRIPIVSKRALGFDFRESMSEAYFTDRYYELKRALLG